MWCPKHSWTDNWQKLKQQKARERHFNDESTNSAHPYSKYEQSKDQTGCKQSCTHKHNAVISDCLWLTYHPRSNKLSNLKSLTKRLTCKQAVWSFCVVQQLLKEANKIRSHLWTGDDPWESSMVRPPSPTVLMKNTESSACQHQRVNSKRAAADTLTERVVANRERRMKRFKLKRAGWENMRVKSGCEELTWILIEGENESGPSRGHQEAIRSSSWVDTCEQALDRWFADVTTESWACDDTLSEWDDQKGRWRGGLMEWDCSNLLHLRLFWYFTGHITVFLQSIMDKEKKCTVTKRLTILITADTNTDN